MNVTLPPHDERGFPLQILPGNPQDFNSPLLEGTLSFMLSYLIIRIAARIKHSAIQPISFLSASRLNTILAAILCFRSFSFPILGKEYFLSKC